VDGRFADIDLIALARAERVVDKARRDGRRSTSRAIDPRLLRNLPLDVRVVLAWDADNTDVDLHVIDPNGERSTTATNASYQGGAITRDATGGYGPEEFALRSPSRASTASRPTSTATPAGADIGHGLMLWLSSGFGTRRSRTGGRRSASGASAASASSSASSRSSQAVTASAVVTIRRGG
jgi:hypothetical protein